MSHSLALVSSTAFTCQPSPLTPASNPQSRSTLVLVLLVCWWPMRSAHLPEATFCLTLPPGSTLGLMMLPPKTMWLRRLAGSL